MWPIVRNSTGNTPDNLCHAGAASAADANADSAAQRVAFTHTATAKYARNANARGFTNAVSHSAHAQHAAAYRLASWVAADEYAGDEHARAVGESFRKSDGSNARNGDAGHGKGRHEYEHGPAANHERR